MNTHVIDSEIKNNLMFILSEVFKKHEILKSSFPSFPPFFLLFYCVYYTMNHAVRGDMEAFASQGIYTAAIAGIIAVGILLEATTVRVYHVWRTRK